MSGFTVGQDMIENFLFRHPLIHVHDEAPVTRYVTNDETAPPPPPPCLTGEVT